MMPDGLKWIAWAALFIVLTGCQPPPPTPVSSLWGSIATLAEAEQSQAPALWVQPDGVLTAAWIGSDSSGVHQDARVVSGPLLGNSRTLPLPPVHPLMQTLLPGPGDLLHLLWLDADENGEQRLYAALLSADLQIERGPTLISDRETLRYTANVVGDGSLMIIWSGGPLAEPALY
ncbi:MAG: hypothetical protein K8J31_01530, partial [Anaerolineae bacterium]|nr:hypothetical protein [Anaerolineae bacterium]